MGSGFPSLLVSESNSSTEVAVESVGVSPEVMATPDVDTPIADGKDALIACDLWEHVYYRLSDGIPGRGHALRRLRHLTIVSKALKAAFLSCCRGRQGRPKAPDRWPFASLRTCDRNSDRDSRKRACAGPCYAGAHDGSPDGLGWF
jgi:hypothetical protein